MDGSSESRPVEVRVVTNEHEWDCLKPAWCDLFEVSPQASATLHFDWLRNWWRVYGARYGGPFGLRIVTIWRSGRLIGALPLYEAKFASPLLGVRRLLFLSTGEDEYEETCADHLD